MPMADDNQPELTVQFSATPMLQLLDTTFSSSTLVSFEVLSVIRRKQPVVRLSCSTCKIFTLVASLSVFYLRGTTLDSEIYAKIRCGWLSLHVLPQMTWAVCLVPGGQWQHSSLSPPVLCIFQREGASLTYFLQRCWNSHYV